jgi:indole-3-glycerol phosphate synthase/phosphoribosylanthranilate isomerase
VFADQVPGDIATIADHLELSAVQLHGSETPETVRQVRSLVGTGCEVWKAIRVEDHLPRRHGTGADRLLFDGGRGGAGTTFEWDLLAGHPERGEVVLAGGLSDENVAIAAAFRPWALDVSSGVESAPGEKDLGKIEAFFGERRRLPGRMR